MAQQVKESSKPPEVKEDHPHYELTLTKPKRHHHDPGLGHKPSYESALAGTPPLES